MYKLLIFMVFTPNLPIPGLSNLPMISFPNLLTSISFKFTLFGLSIFSCRERSSRGFNVIFTTVVNYSKSRSRFHQIVKTKGLDLVSDLGSLLWIKHRSRYNSETNGWPLPVLPMKEGLNHTLCLFRTAWNKALGWKIESINVLLGRYKFPANNHCCI